MKLKDLVGVVNFILRNYWDGKSRINSEVLDKYKLTLEKGVKLIKSILNEEAYFNKIDKEIVSRLKSLLVLMDDILVGWGSRYLLNYKLLRHEEIRRQLFALQLIAQSKERVEFLIYIDNIITDYILGGISAEQAAIRINSLKKVISLNFREGKSFTVTFEGDIIYAMPAALKGGFEKRVARSSEQLTKPQKLVVELASIARRNNPRANIVIISTNRSISTKHAV